MGLRHRLLGVTSDVARGTARSKRGALLLMAASGFAGLGYQIVWTQQCALFLGHEAAAVLAVVAAFFGGVAVGALVLGDRIERSARPLRWYAACEATIAVWSPLLVFAMPRFGDWLLGVTGVAPTPAWQWTVAFVGTFVVLLPATAAMGATLPAIERVVASTGSGQRSIAAYYASNTAGAVLGVLVATFWLVPQVGLSRTALVCGAINLACAIVALVLFPAIAATTKRVPTAARARGTLVRLALTGFLGIGYEVLVVRVLSQVTEDTVYTFALLLAVYLVGTALGAGAYTRWSGRIADPARTGDRLVGALAAACLLGTGSLWGAEAVRVAWFALFDVGIGTAIAIEAVLAVFAFALPTIAMGAVFCHLCREAMADGIGFGRAVGINALAAAAAPLLFGVLLTPLLGPKLVLLSIAAGYLALASRRAWSTPIAWTAVATTAALALLAPPLAFVEVPDGGRIVSYRDGVMASVSVVEDADGVSRLRIDNRQQEGSSATLAFDARQALLPLLLHPQPRRALFLGLGTGVTASSAAADPSLEVDAVELLPEVIDASRFFTQRLDGGARLHPIAADARRFVRATPQHYDVIVADNFHPARSGSGALYTVEHFAAVRARLADGGLFCQWLPLHQLDLDTLRSIVRSFVAVYPDGWAMLASNSLGTPVIGLVARGDGARFRETTLHDRIAHSASPLTPADFGIADGFALLGGFVAGPKSLAAFASDAPLNTDDRPVVTWLAPRITYAPDSLPQDRLVTLLHALSIRPDELIDDAPDVDWTRRLSAYWQARDRFIEAGRGVRPSGDARDMLAQVEQPLLAVLRTSPDFRPAYDPLVRMASSLAHSDPAHARHLLVELTHVQPDRPEARQALVASGLQALP